jgi:uncharacterized protein (TIGR00375 family)
MRFVADFHIHSHYSLATSKQLVPEYLDYWGRLKGIQVLGSGDFTHPRWLAELREKLEEAEPGLFMLKKEFKVSSLPLCLGYEQSRVRFCLTAEISSIYKKNGKVRKTHNLIFAPSFQVAEQIRQQLIKKGANLNSDGRPIIGLSAKDLLDMALSVDPNIFFVPAHIWTPWFSVLGDKSGFDCIEECFEDLSDHIFAVETGLSTDPPMNWLCGFLDRFNLIANSDAHSPEKLGRNANLFNTRLDYYSILKALKNQTDDGFTGTVDLFPEEGKYHADGHRQCQICWTPWQTKANQGICPVCGKAVTVGVLNRIAHLSKRLLITDRKNRKPFFSIIPLKEILAEIYHCQPTTRKISAMYLDCLQKLGNELDVLLTVPISEIDRQSGTVLARAILCMRNRQVFVKEGFDGQYGQISLFSPPDFQKKNQKQNQANNIDCMDFPAAEPRPLLNFDISAFKSQ